MTGARKILIVEDEKPMAHALELKLRHEGFDATAVFDGEMAFQALEKDTFSLILLDLVMPKVDGFTVLKKLKEDGSKTPVIVLSNLGQEEDVKTALSLGAKDFCIKSNTPLITIIERVKKILG
jgi:DNA-binding response OmpR family regulator